MQRMNGAIAPPVADRTAPCPSAGRAITIGIDDDAARMAQTRDLA